MTTGAVGVTVTTGCPLTFTAGVSGVCAASLVPLSVGEAGSSVLSAGFSVGLSAGVVDESAVGAGVAGVSGVAGVVGSAGTSGAVGVVGVAAPVFESLLRAKSPSLGAVEGPVATRSVVGCVRTASFVAIPSSAKEVTGTKAPRVRVSKSKLLYIDFLEAIKILLFFIYQLIYILP